MKVGPKAQREREREEGRERKKEREQCDRIEARFAPNGSQPTPALSADTRCAAHALASRQLTRTSS